MRDAFRPRHKFRSHRWAFQGSEVFHARPRNPPLVVLRRSTVFPTPRDVDRSTEALGLQRTGGFAQAQPGTAKRKHWVGGQIEPTQMPSSTPVAISLKARDRSKLPQFCESHEGMRTRPD